ncbi:hypothetical protein F4604DRAFT_1675952 [Suillus subluteus]|nr:hypothetical protein F4604DRAFT_1675952 [Suillus subluteus]
MSSSSPGSSDSSSNDSSGESDDDPMPATSEVLLGVVGTLYSRRYLVDREPIVRSGENLQLLLMEWKFSHPEIFRAYVRDACIRVRLTLPNVAAEPAEMIHPKSTKLISFLKNKIHIQIHVQIGLEIQL